jgi:glycosyltransferase involved in cell wall biosynthesis
MKVSIITVCLNAEKTIQRCIESVKNQSYNDIEHIIVDGFSNDGTINILNKFKIEYISEKDLGIYDAMNKGVRNASGDYILFLNSDDYLFNEKTIENVVNYIAAFGVDILIGGILVTSNLKNSYEYYPKEAKGLKNDLLVNCLPHQATFAKRELLEKNPFSLNYKVLSDYDWYLGVMSKFDLKISTIREVISVFNYDGLSGSPYIRLPEFFYIQNKNNNLNLEKGVIKKQYLLKINELIRNIEDDNYIIPDKNTNIFLLQIIIYNLEIMLYEKNNRK